MVTSVCAVHWPLFPLIARVDRDRFKEIIVGGTLRGKLVTEVETIGEPVRPVRARQWVAPRHVAPSPLAPTGQGHRTVMVSASLAAYLRPLAKRFGVDAVVGTDSTRSGDRYGDRLSGLNCRAGEKRRRLDQWLEERRWVHAEVWAYGDSAGDRELLARADHAVWVNGATISEIPEVVAG